MRGLAVLTGVNLPGVFEGRSMISQVPKSGIWGTDLYLLQILSAMKGHSPHPSSPETDLDTIVVFRVLGAENAR